MSEIHDGPALGGCAPNSDPRRCTAHNCAGDRCGRWAVKGKTTCANHGGKSTGPRTTGGNSGPWASG